MRFAGWKPLEKYQHVPRRNATEAARVYRARDVAVPPTHSIGQSSYDGASLSTDAQRLGAGDLWCSGPGPLRLRLK